MATTEKAPVPTSAKDKRSSIQKQIDALKEQMAALDQESIHELKLKLSDAKKIVRDLEEELEALTGKPSSSTPKVRRPRTPSISDDILKDQVIKVMALHGKEGMNAKQLAEKLELDPIRIRKYIKDNPKALKRTGNAAATKFFLP